MKKRLPRRQAGLQIHPPSLEKLVIVHSPTTPQPAGPWRIVLAADSLVEQKLLSRLLTRHGHEVWVAARSADIAARVAAGEVDAVLLDGLIASLEGAELIHGIRQLDGAGQQVVIVALVEEPAERDTCLRAGADSCLSRPLQIAEFHDSVRDARPIGATTSTISQHSDIDWQLALDVVGGRQDLLQELIDMFGLEFPAILGAIRTAVEEQDAPRLRMAAHQLKGTLRYFGSTTASDLSERLEELARVGQLDGAAELVQSLANALNELWPRIQQGRN